MIKYKSITWRDFRDLFRKVPKKYLSLRIIYGGDYGLYSFTGFNTIGRITLEQWTGLELLTFLDQLSDVELDTVIPLADDDINAEVSLAGDLNKIIIGPLGVHLCKDLDADVYYPLEDFGDNLTQFELEAKMNKMVDDEGGVLIMPGGRLVIMIDDGAVLMDEDNPEECVTLDLIE